MGEIFFLMVVEGGSLLMYDHNPNNNFYKITSLPDQSLVAIANTAAK